MKADNLSIDSIGLRSNQRGSARLQPRAESAASDSAEFGLEAAIELIEAGSQFGIGGESMSSVLSVFIEKMSLGFTRKERQLLWPLAMNLAKSSANVEAEELRLQRLADWLIIEMLPVAIEAAGSREAADHLGELKSLVDRPGASESRFADAISRLQYARGQNRSLPSSLGLATHTAVSDAIKLVEGLDHSRPLTSGGLLDPAPDSTRLAARAGYCAERIIAAISSRAESVEERDREICRLVEVLDQILTDANAD